MDPVNIAVFPSVLPQADKVNCHVPSSQVQPSGGCTSCSHLAYFSLACDDVVFYTRENCLGREENFSGLCLLHVINMVNVLHTTAIVKDILTMHFMHYISYWNGHNAPAKSRAAFEDNVFF